MPPGTPKAILVGPPSSDGLEMASIDGWWFMISSAATRPDYFGRFFVVESFIDVKGKEHALGRFEERDVHQEWRR